MALNKEIWVEAIQEKLYADSDFYAGAVDHSQYISNKIVHIPNGGSITDVVRNRAGGQAGVTQRTDTDLTYNIVDFSTDPIYVQDSEAVELSYAKLSSVLTQSSLKIKAAIQEEIAWKWGASTVANQLETSGAARTATLASQTGTRLALTFEDILEAQRVMNANNLPVEKRKVLVNPAGYKDLLSISEFQHTDGLMTGILSNGAVGRILGFEVFMTSVPVMYNNAFVAATTPAVKIAIGAAGAITDCGATIFWQDDFVSKAIGEVKVYENEDDATYYGSIVSTRLRGSGNPLRDDELGIVTIIEG